MHINARAWRWFVRIAFIICGMLLIAAAQGWRYDFNERRIIRTGLVDVHSQPNGADLYLNGEYQGRTPIVIETLDPGEYLAELNYSGYHPWQAQLEIFPELATKIENVILFPEEPNYELLTEEGFLDIFPAENSEKYAGIRLLDQQEIVLEIYSKRFVLIERFFLNQEQGITLTNATSTSSIIGDLEAEETLRWQGWWNDRQDVFLLNHYQENVLDGTTDVILSRAYVLRGDNQIIDLATLHRLNPDEDWNLEQPQFYPNSRSLLVTSESYLWAYDLQSGQRKRLLELPENGEFYQAIPRKSFFFDSVSFIIGLQNEEGIVLSRVGEGSDEVIDVSQGHRFSQKPQLTFSRDYDSLLAYDDQITVAYLSFNSNQPQDEIILESVDQVFGWDATEERILLRNTEQELIYFGIAENEFVKIESGNGQIAQQACWHPVSQYIFYLTESKMGNGDENNEASYRLYAVQEQPVEWIELLHDHDLPNIAPDFGYPPEEKQPKTSELFGNIELFCQDENQIRLGAYDSTGNQRIVLVEYE